MKHYSILGYSLSGVGKTTLWQEVVRLLGVKARIWTAEHTGVINDPAIQCWKVNTRDNPFKVLRRAVQGYWPQDPADPKSPLVAPTDETFKEFPVRIFEGIGTFGDYLASNHAKGGLLWHAGRGDVIGPVQEHIQFDDDGDGIGGLCWAHYNIGQRELLGLVQTSQKYPGLTIWSSHEDEGKEKGVPFYGPQVFGNKMTGAIGKEFDEMWHYCTVPIDKQVGGEKVRLLERRLYIEEHFLPGGTMPYKAKTSISKPFVGNHVKLSDKDGNKDFKALQALVQSLNL